MKNTSIKIIGVGEEGTYITSQLVSYDPDNIEILTEIKEIENINELDFLFVLCNLNKKTIQNIKKIINITKEKDIFTVLISNEPKEDIKVDSLITVSGESSSDKSIIVIKALIETITNECNEISAKDIRKILYNKTSIANVGIASGKNRVFKATEKAINDSTLSKSFKDTKNMIINVMGYKKFNAKELSTIDDAIKELMGEDVNTFYSAEINDQVGKDVVVTIIAN